MDNKLKFNNLDSLINFLDKIRIEPLFWIRDYSWYHLLLAQLEIKIDDNNNIFYFCGTNHSQDPAEKMSIDSFLSGIASGDKLLAEDGNGNFNLNNIQDNIKDDIKVKLNQNIFPLDEVNYDEIFRRWGELDYACEKAHSKGAIVMNMDMSRNPQAIPLINDLYGTKSTIRELKAWLNPLIRHDEIISQYIYELLSNAGIQAGYEEVASEKARGFDERLPYNDREDYMAQTILNELNDKPMYVIAHTTHIKEVMRTLVHNGKIVSFYSMLTPTKKEFNSTGWSEDSVIKQYGDNYGKMLLALNRSLNKLLSIIS